MQFLTEALQLPTSVFLMISILSILGALLLKEFFATTLIFIAVPAVSFVMGVAAAQMMRQLEIFPLKKLDQWLLATILASAVGMVCALALAALANRLSGRPSGLATSLPFQVRHVRIGGHGEQR